jgi:hypothetical protein
MMNSKLVYIAVDLIQCQFRGRKGLLDVAPEATETLRSTEYNRSAVRLVALLL